MSYRYEGHRLLADAWETSGMVDAPPTVQYMGELLRRALKGGE